MKYEYTELYTVQRLYLFQQYVNISTVNEESSVAKKLTFCVLHEEVSSYIKVDDELQWWNIKTWMQSESLIDKQENKMAWIEFFTG